MILIGLVLLIVAAVFGLDLLWKNTFPVNDTLVFGQSLGIHTARGFFLIGVITGAVLLLGISLILSGIHRKGRKVIQRRKEKKETGKTHEDRDQLVADNADLRRQLDDKHSSPVPAQGEQHAPAAAADSSRAGATKTDTQRAERHRALRSDVPVMHERPFSTAGAAGHVALPERSHPAPASTLLPRTGTGAP